MIPGRSFFLSFDDIGVARNSPRTTLAGHHVAMRPRSCGRSSPHVRHPGRASIPAAGGNPRRNAPQITPEKKHGQAAIMALALPAHLSDVVMDLSRFFLELISFCGRDRFVARRD